MIHFIRNLKNETLFNIEFSREQGLMCAVDLKVYAQSLFALLASQSSQQLDFFIEDCCHIKQIRKTWDAYHFVLHSDADPNEFIRHACLKFCSKWQKFSYVVD